MSDTVNEGIIHVQLGRLKALVMWATSLTDFSVDRQYGHPLRLDVPHAADVSRAAFTSSRQHTHLSLL